MRHQFADNDAPARRATVSDLALVAVWAAILVPGGPARAESAEDLAKKLSNPVAALISVPFQYNYDHKIGPQGQGHRSLLNIQPVVPISVNEGWNIISRTILPVVAQREIFPGAGDQSGIGDVVQSSSCHRRPRPPRAGSGAPGRFSCCRPAATRC